MIVFAPLITRLYGPEAYGIQGVFMSIVNVMGTVAAMTYPIAIVLPKNEGDAVCLAKASICVGFAMSMLVAIILFLFGSKFLVLLNAKEIFPFMYLIPTFMFISVLSAVMIQWLIRKNAFALTAKVTVWQTLIINMIKTCSGFIYPTAAVLIVTNTLGGLLSALIIFFGVRKADSTDQECAVRLGSWSRTWALAKKYHDFPVFRAPQALLNSISQSLPIIMLASYFGPTYAGYYSIAFAVLGMPISIIGNSVMQVFYPRINEAIRQGDNAKHLIIKAIAALALGGALPFAIILIAGPMLFGFVFGNEWHVAGIYAQWLSIWLFFQFINKPAVAAIPALRLQRGLLIYEIFSSSTKILALYLGYTLFKSDVAAVALFAIFGIAAYTWLILWVIFHCGKLATMTLSTWD